MSTDLQPLSPSDTRALRNCLGTFATGVTVVTCEDRDGQLQGVTANSFSSVSLDPALVLWSIDKTSDTLQAFLDAQYFGINVLRAEQQTLSNHFARSEPGLFEGQTVVRGHHGAPLLPGCLTCFECRQYALHEAGDHHIIIGQVLAMGTNPGTPLLFWNGRYGELADSTP